MNYPIIENGQVVYRPVKLYKRREGVYVAKVGKAVVGYVENLGKRGYCYGFGDPDNEDRLIDRTSRPHEDPYTRSKAFSEMVHLATCYLR